MKRGKSITGNMLGSAVGIDIGEPSSAVTFLSPNVEVLHNFSFDMDDTGFDEFRNRIPANARIAFEATGLAYVVMKRLRSLGCTDITRCTSQGACPDCEIEEEGQCGQPQIGKAPSGGHAAEAHTAR